MKSISGCYKIRYSFVPSNVKLYVKIGIFKGLYFLLSINFATFEVSYRK